MPAASDATERNGASTGPTFEVFAVFDTPGTARTEAWRLERAGLGPEHVDVLGRAGPVRVGAERRQAIRRTGTVPGAVAAAVLCVAAGLLLAGLAGGAPAGTP